jgi:hypothetical protein
VTFAIFRADALHSLIPEAPEPQRKHAQKATKDTKMKNKRVALSILVISCTKRESRTVVGGIALRERGAALGEATPQVSVDAIDGPGE